MTRPPSEEIESWVSRKQMSCLLAFWGRETHDCPCYRAISRPAIQRQLNPVLGSLANLVHDLLAPVVEHGIGAEPLRFLKEGWRRSGEDL